MFFSRTPDRDFRCLNTYETARGKDKKQIPARRPHASRTSIREVIVMLKLRHHVTPQRTQDFL